MTEVEPYSLKLIFAWFKSSFIAQYFNLSEIQPLFLDFAYLIIYTYQPKKMEYASRSLSTQVNQKAMPNSYKDRLRISKVLVIFIFSCLFDCIVEKLECHLTVQTPKWHAHGL